MSKRSVFAVLLALALVWWMKERFFVSEETRVRRRLSHLASAVEGNNLLALTDGIARDYCDEHGLDRGSLIAGIKAYRAQYEALWIHISDLSLEVATDSRNAKATFVAKVLSTSKNGGVRAELDTERLRLFFRKDSDRVWRLVGAETPKLRFK